MDQRRGENDKIADNGAEKKNPREPTRSALPIQFKSKIQELSGANSIDGEILVIQKSLTSRDVDDQQGCFFIPSYQIQQNYRNCLDSDEVAHLKMGEDRDDVGEDLFFLPVICVEPRLKFSLLFLKRWNPNPASEEDSMCYGLTKNWNDIKSRNNLKMGDVVQLWAVRAGENMWFVLHNLTTAGNETDEEPKNNEAKNNTATNLRRTGLPMELSSKIQELTGAESIDDEILVIHKTLARRDVNDTQGCFFIPSDQILSSSRDFLDSDQVAHLKMVTGEGKHLSTPLPVMLLEPKLKICLAFLKRWITKETNSVPEGDTMSYVLAKTWNGIVSRNDLKEHQIVQLWAVRVRGILWFVLRNLTNNLSDSEDEAEPSSQRDDHSPVAAEAAS